MCSMISCRPSRSRRTSAPASASPSSTRQRLQQQHRVRVSGDRRRRLEHRPAIPPQPGWTLFRHDHPNLNWTATAATAGTAQQQFQRDGEPAATSSALAAPPPRRRRRPWRRRRSWCSSTGTARTCRSRRWRPSSRRPTPSRPRATPASPRPAIPTRRARKPRSSALADVVRAPPHVEAWGGEETDLGDARHQHQAVADVVGRRWR